MDIKVFTVKEYLKARRLCPNIYPKFHLAEEGAKYYLSEEQKEEEVVHDEHDKLFKKILERPEEAEKLIRRVLKIGEEEKLELELERNEFITIDFRGKLIDMLYKLKDKEVYFIIEHQSTQDEYMSYRILQYETQVMEGSFQRLIAKGKLGRKTVAKVIAIVIYTGEGKWKASKRVEEIQEEFGNKREEYGKEEYGEVNYDGIGEYNAISIADYKEEELLKEGSLLSRAMLIEKARRDDELVEILEKIIPMTKENEIADMISIIRYILIKDLGIERAKKYIEKLEGGIKMSGFVNYLRQDRERTMQRIKEEGEKLGEERGKKIGEKRGEKQGIIKMAKNMLREKIDIETIEKITNLNRKQFM